MTIDLSSLIFHTEHSTGMAQRILDQWRCGNRGELDIFGVGVGINPVVERPGAHQ